jgi:FAD dependent oxidoreductase
MKDNVIIMGAGIQGICSALALSNLGIPVTLIDKTPEPLSRSGLRNEGKIHLGFIYANDPTFRSASLMLHAAVNFSPMIESFVGRTIDWTPLRSRKFNYLILEETMLHPDRILDHYEKLQGEYERIKDSSLHYLGNRPDALFTNKHLEIPELNRDIVKMCVPTEELAVNLGALRELLITEMKARNNIVFLGNYCIEEIQRTSYGYRLTGKKEQEEKWSLDTGRLINCLWERRLYFDRQLGFHTNRKWVYRLKYRILGVPVDHIAALDSFTCVLGAFGDLVNYDNHHSYLSWYPECMRGWSSELTTPESWEDACNGKMLLEEKEDWVDRALAGLDCIFPGLKNFDIRQLDGGIIFSWGDTDIDDIGSELHNRFEIGVNHVDGYYSVDTGKYTSAPYFAGKLQKYFL